MSIGLILISVVTYFCFAFSGFIVQPVPFYFVWLHKARPLAADSGGICNFLLLYSPRAQLLQTCSLLFNAN